MEVSLIDYIKKMSSETLEDQLTADDDLLGSGIIDSLGMMKLVFFIETEFGVKIPPEDMTLENFMTVNNIIQYLNEKKSRQ